MTFTSIYMCFTCKLQFAYKSITSKLLKLELDLELGIYITQNFGI